MGRQQELECRLAILRHGQGNPPITKKCIREDVRQGIVGCEHHIRGVRRGVKNIVEKCERARMARRLPIPEFD